MENLSGNPGAAIGKKSIRFELLGAFSYGKKGTAEHGGAAVRAGKKALSFLQYLIVNHRRCISSEELIEKFWTEKSKAPGNALRNMLFKVRNLLKEMFPDEEELLLTLPVGYMWSPDVRLELDTEQFEEACLEAGKKPGNADPEELLKAIALYRGDFLSANDSDWAVVSRQYYRALYLDACKAVLPILYKKERWIEMTGVCEQAYRIDFTVEEFTAYQMRALIALGQSEQARAVYEAFGEKLEEELGLFPGEQIEQIRALALKMGKNDLQAADIFKLICGEQQDQHAFFCTFEMFQNIVALEKRHLMRSGQCSTLVIVSLGKEAVPATDARRLERILLEGLRLGDPVARLEAGSYIMMLAGVDKQKAQLVVSRLDSSFHKIYRHSKAQLMYQFAVLKY